jgi:hypothetical protein
MTAAKKTWRPFPAPSRRRNGPPPGGTNAQPARHGDGCHCLLLRQERRFGLDSCLSRSPVSLPVTPGLLPLGGTTHVVSRGSFRGHVHQKPGRAQGRGRARPPIPALNQSTARPAGAGRAYFQGPSRLAATFHSHEVSNAAFHTFYASVAGPGREPRGRRYRVRSRSKCLARR